jgi:hypothetical protein
MQKGKKEEIEEEKEVIYLLTGVMQTLNWFCENRHFRI